MLPAGHLKITATLTGYANETIPGKSVIAGQTKGPDAERDASLHTHTPEPATSGMLAIGAPGLSSWRREESLAGALGSDCSSICYRHGVSEVVWSGSGSGGLVLVLGIVISGNPPD